MQVHPERKLSPLATFLRKGLVLAAALAIAPAFAAQGSERAETPAAVTAQAAKPARPSAKKADAGKAKKADAAKARDGKARDAKAAEAGRKGKQSAAKKQEDLKPGPLADFGNAEAPADVVHVANWVSYTRNAKRKAFVIIDKKAAQLYVFAPDGKLKSHTPVLLGKAVGDHVDPASLNKPLSQLTDAQKTTPAGRFLAMPGRNTGGEDIIWIDYNAAVSMHRLRKVSAEERRAERMATPDATDNRISNGCVNVPHKFYNAVLKPTVTKQGAFVYVLPETRPPQQLFGSFDVPSSKG